MRYRLALALLVGIAGAGPAPAQSVRVGAWNIEHLGFPDSRSGPAEDIAQDPADIADYIKASRVDVLALSEIGDDDGVASTRSNKTLTKAFELLKQQTGNEWKYVLFPKAVANEKTQLTGLAWNTKRARQEGSAYRIPVPRKVGPTSVWDRRPYAVKLSFGEGKSDVVFIPVHMKSNYDGVVVGRKRRLLEAQALIDDLDRVRGEFQDSDLMVLGDTNILKAEEGAAVAIEEAGFKDVNFLDLPTTWRGAAPFDRFYLSNDPDDNKEFRYSRMDVFKEEYLPGKQWEPVDFKKKLSDHFMVRTTIRVLDDDD